MRIFTIGFTKTTAESFFERLCRAGVKQVVDVRLNNVSQLAAFTKKNDLRYFLRAIGGIDYVHRPELAPTQQILDAYRKHGADWAAYERSFIALMKTRRIEQTLSPAELEDSCLLCSENKPHHCHFERLRPRRVLANAYLRGCDLRATRPGLPAKAVMQILGHTDQHDRRTPTGTWTPSWARK